MKDMLKMGLFLFVVSAVAGILLAITEEITAPRIAENKKALLEQARKEVLPQAAVFSQNEFKSNEGSAAISYSAGFDQQGNMAGVVLSVYPKGYAGAIEMVVGLSKEGKIAGVKILSQKETPGLGTKLADPVFLEPFKKLVGNKESPIFMVKQDGGDVDAITAATISSRAFCAGIRNSLDAFNLVKGQLESLKAPEQISAPVTGGAQ
ncbi:MAG: RnfABCDGE type electron transport complex subunit G [Candidatus Rifleibacteriota bacterium]